MSNQKCFNTYIWVGLPGLGQVGDASVRTHQDICRMQTSLHESEEIKQWVDKYYNKLTINCHKTHFLFVSDK